MKTLWFTGGFVVGLMTLSLAMGAVPKRAGRITDDTALYQNLSEIRVPPQGELNFDNDIQRLDAARPRYKEKLPSLARNPRIAGPMQKIAQSPYRPASKARPVARD